MCTYNKKSSQATWYSCYFDNSWSFPAWTYCTKIEGKPYQLLLINVIFLCINGGKDGCRKPYEFSNY